MRTALAAGLLAFSLAVSGGAVAADRCGVPAEVAALGGSMPRTAARLANGQPVTIVAFGSSSTYGTGASRPSAAYPARLEKELRSRFPGRAITVVNKGVPGEASEAMMARFDRDTGGEADLVIWQTGTNDVARGQSLADFAARTRDGIARLKAAGVDVILMEPQYYPKLLQSPDYTGYLHQIRSLGQELGVPVLRRFDLMVHWLQSGQIAMAKLLAADHFHMHDQSYACLAKVLAQEIAGTVKTVAKPQLVAVQPQ